jgi:AcrR family transcriptional regulator
MQTRTARARTSRAPAAKRRKRRTPEEIRARVLGAAREEFKERGYAGATTAAIARRADVAEIQMFRYFPSKGDLFHQAVFAQMRDHLRAFNLEHAPKSGDQFGRLYMTELQTFLEAHAKALISLLFTQTYGGPASDMSTSKILQGFFNDNATLMASRVERAPSAMDAGTLVRVAFGAVLGCITYKDWLFPNAAANSGAIETAITEFVLAGVGPYSDVRPSQHAGAIR